MAAEPAERETPRVRVVVVNYDGGDMTYRCLEALQKTEWPSESMEVVLVDNASIDGLTSRLRVEMPDVTVIESNINRGFAGGCNLAMRDLDGIDYVALVNNDAVVDPGWLAPLVEALESDPSVGAANARIVLMPRFYELRISSSTFRPPPGDSRPGLGVMVSGIEVGGRPAWQDVVFGSGFYPREQIGPAAVRWTGEEALLAVPLPDEGTKPESVRLRLATHGKRNVVTESGCMREEFEVGPEPKWFDVPLGGPSCNVINNTGSVLVEGGYGADRGFLQPDRGQFDDPAEVFAWCGAAVLLSVRYLRDVGIFDDHYFLYYEDFDLSWRGRLAGWRYVYVPSSYVRHEHAASTIEGSSLFLHFVERNRLITLTRNAPRDLVFNAIVGQAFALLRDRMVRPVLRGRRPTVAPGHTASRARAMAAYVKALPRALRARSAIRRSAKVDDSEILRWMRSAS